MPEIHGVTQVSPPAAPNASPGSPVTTTITLQNQGNVSENTALDVSLPPGLTASGLSPVSLGVGQSASQTLTLTPAANAPLNTTLTATVTYGPASTTDVVSVLERRRPTRPPPRWVKRSMSRPTCSAV